MGRARRGRCKVGGRRRRGSRLWELQGGQWEVKQAAEMECGLLSVCTKYGWMDFQGCVKNPACMSVLDFLRAPCAAQRTVTRTTYYFLDSYVLGQGVPLPNNRITTLSKGPLTTQPTCMCSTWADTTVQYMTCTGTGTVLVRCLVGTITRTPQARSSRRRTSARTRGPPHSQQKALRSDLVMLL